MNLSENRAIEGGYICLTFVCLLFIAGCSTTDVGLENRDISVERNAEPTSSSIGSDMSALVGRVGPSYVTLTVSTTTDGSQSIRDANRSPITSGSGFVVDSSGYVMTAGHVAVKAGNTVSARAANGRAYSGKVMQVLADNDMALIKLRGFHGQAVVPVANPCLARGADIFSLGKPHAQGDTARVGSVESMSFGRAVRYGKFGYPDAMVMRMNTQKGESGGPVFDYSGKLAGMVVSTLSDGNGQSLSRAHAVSASRLADFLCKNSQCSGAWSAIATENPLSCS